MTNPQSPIKLVTRTRNKWKQTGTKRSAADSASALGYIAWQLALNAARNLHVNEFRYDDDEQRIRVIEEYLAFLVHLADRIAFDILAKDDRVEFVSAAARAAARHLQRNAEEIIGTGDHGVAFLGLFNARTREYGACAHATEPGYSMLRALGNHVQDVMGVDQTNKWVADHVVEIEAPDLHRRLFESVVNLLESA